MLQGFEERGLIALGLLDTSHFLTDLVPRQ